MVSRQTISTAAAANPVVLVPELAQRRWRRAHGAWLILLSVCFVAALVGWLHSGWHRGWMLSCMFIGMGGNFLTWPPVQPEFDAGQAHRYRWAKIRTSWCLFYSGGALLAWAGQSIVGEMTPFLLAVAGGIIGVWLLLAQKATEP